MHGAATYSVVSTTLSLSTQRPAVVGNSGVVGNTLPSPEVFARGRELVNHRLVRPRSSTIPTKTQSQQRFFPSAFASALDAGRLHRLLSIMHLHMTYCYRNKAPAHASSREEPKKTKFCMPSRHNSYDDCSISSLAASSTSNHARHCGGPIPRATALALRKAISKCTDHSRPCHHLSVIRDRYFVSIGSHQTDRNMDPMAYTLSMVRGNTSTSEPYYATCREYRVASNELGGPTANLTDIELWNSCMAFRFVSKVLAAVTATAFSSRASISAGTSLLQSLQTKPCHSFSQDS